LKVHLLRCEQIVPAAPARAFALFADAHNLERITPPWLRFRILTPAPIRMDTGTRIDYRLVLHGLPLRWTAEIREWEPGHRFVDVQVRGPYALWEHTHTFEPAGSGTALRDVVRYALPLGPLGELANRFLVRRDLERIFDFRQRAALSLLASSPAVA
jgi:ligand-binding SRPBCC domain-containing protein